MIYCFDLPWVEIENEPDLKEELGEQYMLEVMRKRLVFYQPLKDIVVPYTDENIRQWEGRIIEYLMSNKYYESKEELILHMKKIRVVIKNVSVSDPIPFNKKYYEGFVEKRIYMHQQLKQDYYRELRRQLLFNNEDESDLINLFKLTKAQESIIQELTPKAILTLFAPELARLMDCFSNNDTEDYKKTIRMHLITILNPQTNKRTLEVAIMNDATRKIITSSLNSGMRKQMIKALARNQIYQKMQKIDSGATELVYKRDKDLKKQVNEASKQVLTDMLTSRHVVIISSGSESDFQVHKLLTKWAFNNTKPILVSPTQTDSNTQSITWFLPNKNKNESEQGVVVFTILPNMVIKSNDKYEIKDAAIPLWSNASEMFKEEHKVGAVFMLRYNTFFEPEEIMQMLITLSDLFIDPKKSQKPVLANKFAIVILFDTEIKMRHATANKEHILNMLKKILDQYGYKTDVIEMVLVPSVYETVGEVSSVSSSSKWQLLRSYIKSVINPVLEDQDLTLLDFNPEITFKSKIESIKSSIDKNTSNIKTFLDKIYSSKISK